MDNLKPFSPSLDWGGELLRSVLWIGRAWAIAAVCLMIVLVLIARYTTWGRQFWRVTGAYFTGRHSIKVWLWLGAILLSVIATCDSVSFSAIRSTTSTPRYRSPYREWPRATRW